MLFLIAFVGAAIIAVVLWKAMNSGGAEFRQIAQRRPTGRPSGSSPQATGPDDDPEFLRQLDERVRRRDEPPGA